MAVHLRKRITPLIPKYLVELPQSDADNTSKIVEPEFFEVEDLLRSLDVEKLEPCYLKGGRKQAIKHYQSFLDDKLEDYADQRNDPNMDLQSHMSPYLHFGQVSPIELALIVQERKGDGPQEYLEQLIVRRELAFNMVHYNPEYDNIKCLPDWAQTTLREQPMTHTGTRHKPR